MAETLSFGRWLKRLRADLDLTHEALYRTLARMAAEGEIKRLRGPTSVTAAWLRLSRFAGELGR